MRELFEQATSVPTGQRESFIAQVSADDAELREELMSLVAADECQRKKPLTDAISQAMDRTTDDLRRRLIGSRIGDYKLKRLLGHGGVGSVYLAEYLPASDATAPAAAHVAIKIVEGAAVRPETRRRFRDERQILANLNHPNVARLFDAGDTQQGYPYLVMDLVEGMPIDRYCDRHRLSVEDRIRLFLHICSAVQCAHDNLIVHRDLKPGNILVTADGVPKLLDFGIAKMLSVAPDDNEPALTRMKDQMLTPEYASPEQIRGDRVTTASDVYSLGVLLYELLTGLRPYRVAARNQLELERTVCIADAPRPSTAVRQAILAGRQEPFPTRNIDTIAEYRKLTAVRLRTKLSGDLDAILMKALRKEPHERYSSAQHLAADLQRYLDHEPVEAKRGNWSYHASRFVRRHAVGVATMTGLVLAALGTLIVMSHQLRAYVRERDTAIAAKQLSEDMTRFMENIFDSPGRGYGAEVTAIDLLDTAADRIATDLKQPTPLKAQLLQTIGFNLARLEKTEAGIQLIEKSVAIRRSHLSEDKAGIANGVLTLGRAYTLNGDFQNAHRYILEAISIFEEFKNTGDRGYVDAQYRLATNLIQQGHIEEALTRLEAVLQPLTRIYGRRSPEVARTMVDIGNAHLWTSNTAAAESVLREARSIYADSVPELHPDRVDVDRMLAQALQDRGNISEAVTLLTAVAENRRKVHGPDSFRYAHALGQLSGPVRSLGNLSLAERYVRQAVAIGQRTRGKHDTDTAYYQVSLAITLSRRKKYREAVARLTDSLATYQMTLEPGHPYIHAANHYLSEAFIGLNQSDKAAELARGTIAGLQAATAAPWRIARTENTLGFALFKLKKFDAAAPLLESSYRILASSVGPDPYTVRLAKERLEQFYAATGNTTQLVALRSNFGANVAANKQ